VGDPIKKANKIANKNAKPAKASGKVKRAMANSSKRKSAPKKSNSGYSDVSVRERRGPSLEQYKRNKKTRPKSIKDSKVKAQCKKKTAMAGRVCGIAGGFKKGGYVKSASKASRISDRSRKKVAKSRGKRTYYGSK